MITLIAIGHIVGVLIVLLILSVLARMLAEWEIERNDKVALQEIFLNLGISSDELDKPKHVEKLIEFSAARFNSELFRNRLSDLCGWIQKGWGWLSLCTQICVLLAVIWYTITDDSSNSIHAWWIVAISLFFFISSIFFGLTCKLLTGRFPGQARQARKALAQVVAQRHMTDADGKN